MLTTMADASRSLEHRSPTFIISAGTQVVLKVSKALPDGSYRKPGTVGVVVESPPHQRRGVRRAVCRRRRRPRAYFRELVLRRKEVEAELGQTTDDLRPFIIYQLPGRLEGLRPGRRTTPTTICAASTCRRPGCTGRCIRCRSRSKRKPKHTTRSIGSWKSSCCWRSRRTPTCWRRSGLRWCSWRRRWPRSCGRSAGVPVAAPVQDVFGLRPQPVPPDGGGPADRQELQAQARHAPGAAAALRHPRACHGRDPGRCLVTAARSCCGSSGANCRLTKSSGRRWHWSESSRPPSRRTPLPEQPDFARVNEFLDAGAAGAWSMLDLHVVGEYVAVAAMSQPLFVTVSGAHLYGFESPDSDVDLRGCHLLPLREVVGPAHAERDAGNLRHARGNRSRSGQPRRRQVFPLAGEEQRLRPGADFFAAGRDRAGIPGPPAADRPPLHHAVSLLPLPRLLQPRSGSCWKRKSPKRAKSLLYAYRVLLTGIHLLRTGDVEANLRQLNERFQLPFIDELIASKTGGERIGLPALDWQFHDAELRRLEQQIDDGLRGLPAGRNSRHRRRERPAGRIAADARLVRLTWSRRRREPTIRLRLRLRVKRGFDDNRPIARASARRRGGRFPSAT